MIEEGPLATSSDFHMREREAYPQLYQESAARKTRDKAINILQGRCVGGGTTVNWTSSFRTPSDDIDVLVAHVRHRRFHRGRSGAVVRAHRTRLNIMPWAVAPNENNDVLRRGAEALGIPVATIRRNVKGCWNIGYCGVGCPTNAKQSMLVTTIPAALSNRRDTADAHACMDIRSCAVETSGPSTASASTPRGTDPGPRRIVVRARTFIAAGGAIGTPALLLRSTRAGSARPSSASARSCTRPSCRPR